MEITCPLSKSSNIEIVEIIKVKDIVKLYQKSLAFNVYSEFKDLQEIKFYHCCDSDLSFFYPAITGTEVFYEKLQNFE